MSTYNFIFEVAGDQKADYWSIIKTVEADSLEDAIEKSWDSYKASINRIIKTPHEALVVFEPTINPLFSLTGTCDNIPLDETSMLNAFFKKRLKEYHNMHPYWI